MATADCTRLLGFEDEARTFWRLRLRTARSSLRQLLATSRLRVSLVVALSCFFWMGLYLLFSEGFHFLGISIGDAATHAQTVHAIYNVFFASLMCMLVISSGIIAYSGLYCSPEAAFLLSTPARPERIVLHKFQESLLFSSWGFLLLGSPMLVAYGVEASAPWYYYALLLPYMLSFIYIPGALGLLACLLIVYRVPKIRFHGIPLVGILVCTALLAGWWATFWRTESNLLTPVWFQELLDRLRFSEHRLLPSWWLSSGLLEAARLSTGFEQQQWTDSLMFLALLIANALFAHLIVAWLAGRIYRPSYAALQSQRSSRRAKRPFWLDQFLVHWLPVLTPQMRLLLVKDLRVFRRDPVQWSQFLIFFGLLALYFINIRRFTYDVSYVGWVNMISFLNLAVIGLILSTFTTRFIFPMVSLEGRRFWILGLLPVRRESILWSKFIFAATGAMLPSTLLILLSDVMLGISWVVVLVHQAICLILCVGLSGIAVGLGAAMPNLHEISPSKIAAGFGGTLTLVLSAMYIVAVVVLTAVPCHFYLAAKQADLVTQDFSMYLAGGTAASLVLGLVATVVPMRRGLRAFRELEF